MQRQEFEHSVSNNNPNQDTYPLPRPARRVAISLQNPGSGNQALRRKMSLIHALAAGAASIGALGELVYYHALEDEGLINSR